MSTLTPPEPLRLTRDVDPDPAPVSSRSAAMTPWQRALIVNGAAIAVVSALFVWMVWRSHQGTNVAGLQMPAMGLQHRVGYWWRFLMGETLGIAALIWAYLSVLVGLLFSARRPRRLGLSSRRLNDIHRHLSLTTITLILGHALFVALGGMTNAMTHGEVNFLKAFVPFQTTWNMWPYAYGIFAMYLSLVLGPTYYLRRRVGERAWRTVHRATLAVYVLSVIHTLYFDDFDFHGPYRLGLWIAQIPLAALMLWRVRKPVRASLPRGSDGSRRASPVVLSARIVVGAAALGSMVVLAVLLISGHFGGEPSPFHRGHKDGRTPSVKSSVRGMPGMKMGG